MVEAIFTVFNVISALNPPITNARWYLVCRRSGRRSDADVDVYVDVERHFIISMMVMCYDIATIEMIVEDESGFLVHQ